MPNARSAEDSLASVRGTDPTQRVDGGAHSAPDDAERELNDRRRTWLALAAAEGCGPGMIAPLLAPDLDPAEILTNPSVHRLPPAVARRLADPQALERTGQRWLTDAARLGLALITAADADYPARMIDHPLRPMVLFGRGNLGLLAAERCGIAIVGSRTPTGYGEAATQDFAGAIAAAGVPIWSGLAAGVDALAHRAALRAGSPTVAVLAGGLDRIYPAGHVPLADRIVTAGGLLISESPPGLRAQRGHFPRRNRILAGAAAAVLVVEAGLASGSLHTARFAADAGVPVFAVPGVYTSSRSAGCHALIADGAQIARDPQDLLRRLGIEWSCARDPTEPALEHSADQVAILQLLAEGPRPADLVLRESRLAESTFLLACQQLRAAGSILELPGDLLALRTAVSR